MRQLVPLRWCVPAMLVVAVAAGCSRQSPPSTASLDGAWAGFEAGQPTAKCTLTISGAQFDYRGAQSNDWCRGTFVVNEQTQPKQIDMAIQEIAVQQYLGKTIPAIFELNGDELKVAAAEPGSAVRPATLGGGQGIRVFSFKRD